METRLYNIFKSKNVTKLTNSIVESSYNFLLDTFKTDLKLLAHFLWAVKLLATFNLQIDITMEIF